MKAFYFKSNIIIIYIICLSYFIYNSLSIKYIKKQYNNKHYRRKLLNDECNNSLSINNNNRFIKSDDLISLDSIITHTNMKLASTFYHGPITLYEMSSNYLDLLESKLLINITYIKCFEPGVILYINTNYLYHFFNEIYDQIMVPFVLVSGGACDDSVPGI
jgi:hypothetical protein